MIDNDSLTAILSCEAYEDPAYSSFVRAKAAQVSHQWNQISLMILAMRVSTFHLDKEINGSSTTKLNTAILQGNIHYVMQCGTLSYISLSGGIALKSAMLINLSFARTHVSDFEMYSMLDRTIEMNDPMIMKTVLRLINKAEMEVVNYMLLWISHHMEYLQFDLANIIYYGTVMKIHKNSACCISQELQVILTDIRHGHLAIIPFQQWDLQAAMRAY